MGGSSLRLGFPVKFGGFLGVWVRLVQWVFRLRFGALVGL